MINIFNHTFSLGHYFNQKKRWYLSICFCWTLVACPSLMYLLPESPSPAWRSGSDTRKMSDRYTCLAPQVQGAIIGREGPLISEAAAGIRARVRLWKLPDLAATRPRSMNDAKDKLPVTRNDYYSVLFFSVHGSVFFWFACSDTPSYTPSWQASQPNLT